MSCVMDDYKSSVCTVANRAHMNRIRLRPNKTDTVRRLFDTKHSSMTVACYYLSLGTVYTVENFEPGMWLHIHSYPTIAEKERMLNVGTIN